MKVFFYKKKSIKERRIRMKYNENKMNNMSVYIYFSGKLKKNELLSYLLAV